MFGDLSDPDSDVSRLLREKVHDLPKAESGNRSQRLLYCVRSSCWRTHSEEARDTGCCSDSGCIVMLAGLAAYGRQLTEGLAITGMSRDVTWGLYIAQFTFLVGVAASAVMVVIPYYLHDYKAFGRMVILGEFLAVSAVLMCMLFVFVDLGQPRRVLNVLLYPSPHSVMFWDMVVLSGYLLLNLVIGGVTLEAERKGARRPSGSSRWSTFRFPGRSASTRSRRSFIRAWPPGLSG